MVIKFYDLFLFMRILIGFVLYGQSKARGLKSTH